MSEIRQLIMLLLLLLAGILWACTQYVRRLPQYQRRIVYHITSDICLSARSRHARNTRLQRHLVETVSKTWLSDTQTDRQTDGSTLLALHNVVLTNRITKCAAAVSALAVLVLHRMRRSVNTLGVVAIASRY